MTTKTVDGFAESVAIHSIVTNDEHDVLYRAQEAALEVIHYGALPCYSDEYIATIKGIKWTLIYGYNQTYKFCSILISIPHRIQIVVFCICNFVFGWAYSPISNMFAPITNRIYPVNPINGLRHFTLINRYIEKFLGDYIFYPLNASGMTKTFENLMNTNIGINEPVDEVVTDITQHNKVLLNPKNEVEFNYRAKTVISSKINAFSVPAGGMVVYSQLVKELHGALSRTHKIIQETKVQLPDGSVATIGLENITLKDVLASLVGHEMTHVASRHCITRMMEKLALSIIAFVGKIALKIYLLTSNNKGCRQLSSIEGFNSSETNSQHLAVYKICACLIDKIQNLRSLFTSRRNEYEADVTGIYFSSQAGYNPLGALYLHEFFLQNGDDRSNFLRRWLEPLFTHPCEENRKLAILAAIAELTPDKLRGKLTISGKNETYNSAYSGTALQFTNHLEKLLTLGG